MKPELKNTEDGSHTLYIRELDEHFHSRFGAITEAGHVYIEAGLKSIDKNDLNILEIGFGTGLNAFLTLLEIRRSGKKASYTGLEKYPLNTDITQSLNYKSLFKKADGNLFDLLHKAPWSKKSSITDEFTLEKIQGDICDMEISNQFDLVYYDAFGPDKQPEVWTTKIFEKIFHSMLPGSILTTYSTKGQVRRNMKKAGLRVEKLPGPPGKFDMTRAWKD